MQYAPRALCISLPPHSLSSLQRACNSILCLTRWQLFFLFFSPAEVCSAGFGKVFIPPALTSFKIRAVFIFPLDRNTSFFFFFLFELSCYSFLRIYKVLLLFYYKYMNSQWSTLPSGANIDPEQCPVYCVWPLIWPRSPRLLKMTDISHNILLKYCVEPLCNKIFLEDCLQEQTVKYFLCILYTLKCLWSV